MADLSHNDILDLPPATFLSQLNMLFVDLSHNKILRTPYSAFNRRVVTVLLQGDIIFFFNFKTFTFRKSLSVRRKNSYVTTRSWCSRSN